MIVIGTRNSALAMTQSRGIAKDLAQLGVESRLEQIRTQGDKIQHLSLDKLEGKGFFTKEIEQALLAGHIDMAVHCLKDLPSDVVEGLVVAAVPPREDVRDCLIISKDAYDPSAPKLPIVQGARVGTSAIRRKAQLYDLRPDLTAVDVRGNVPTRIGRLADGHTQAIVLAMAGLRRLALDLPHLHVVPLPVDLFVPAPGQGALALQCRADDTRTIAILKTLHHAHDAQLVACERGLLGLLHAGCHVPLGAHATQKANHMQLSVFFGNAAFDAADAGVPHRFVIEAPDAQSAAQAAFERLGGKPLLP
jgi:hydroxymethylbilane synthase